jgi:uncharacterized protein (TIGR02466 family)
MSTQLFFGTPIYYTKTDIIEDLTELESHAVYSTEYHKDNDIQSSTFLSNHNVVEYHPRVEQKIVQIAKDYVATLNTDIDTSRMKIMNSWFNNYPDGGFVGWHNHNYVHNTISMVYYIDIEDGPIHFKSPNPFSSGFPCSNTNEMTNSEVILEPKPMDLLMFPSWLMHKTAINSKGKRKIFSANLQF